MESIFIVFASAVAVERLIHIVPLGWEADRAVLPIKSMRGHGVYLLANPDSHPLQRHFLQLVRRRLEEIPVEVTTVRVDAAADLKGLVNAIGRIIQKEVKAGNRVYINASAAGKIAAVAATLAGMAHLAGNGLVYYARPEDYILSEEEQMRHGLTRGLDGDPMDIPLFRISLPSPSGCLVLCALAVKGKAKSATYQDLFNLLHSAHFSGFPQITKDTKRSIKGRATVNLTKTILRPLREAGYISIEREGKRAIVTLTKEGELMADLIARE